MSAVGIVETFITFGVQYREHPTCDDERHPVGMHGNGYAVIESPSRGAARDIAFAIFGDAWAFDYDEQPEPPFASAGELLRIAWVVPGGVS